jgi:hypothetical protein
MAKEGLSRGDIKKYHKMMLEEELPLPVIAKKLHTKVSVLKRLTPEKIENARKAAAETERKLRASKEKQQTAMAAAVEGALKSTSGLQL